MMLVVADTGPLNYLIQIGADHILPKLFGEVIIPSAVLTELLDADTPKQVRDWIEHLPSWASVRTPMKIEPLNLDPGEVEAIALMIELRADLLIVDDLDARGVAEKQGLAIVGTTGTLERAAAAGMIDLEIAFNRLRLTSFRGSSELYAAALDRNRKRRDGRK